MEPDHGVVVRHDDWRAGQLGPTESNRITSTCVKQDKHNMALTLLTTMPDTYHLLSPPT